MKVITGTNGKKFESRFQEVGKIFGIKVKVDNKLKEKEWRFE